MNEEVESNILDSAGDDTSSVVDSAPLGTSSLVTSETEQGVEPETSVQPVEVISVDELLDRLTASEEGSQSSTEEVLPADEVEVEVAAEVVEEPSSSDTTVELLETIQQDVTQHPFLTTDFADYTVTEGLLLLALVGAVAVLCIKMLKEGFSWL